MSIEIRDEIVGTLEQILSLHFQGVPARFPNQPFNLENPPDKYIEVEYDLIGGDQVYLGTNTPTRVSGYIYVRAYTRKMTGSRWGADVCGGLFTILRTTVFNSFNTRHPEYGMSGEAGDYYVQTVKCRLWADLN
jgi:hypothetical protein